MFDDFTVWAPDAVVHVTREQYDTHGEEGLRQMMGLPETAVIKVGGDTDMSARREFMKKLAAVAAVAAIPLDATADAIPLDKSKKYLIAITGVPLAQAQRDVAVLELKAKFAAMGVDAVVVWTSNETKIEVFEMEVHDVPTE